MWCTRLQLSEDGVPNGLRISSELGVPEAQDLNALRGQKPVPLRVMLDLAGISVASAVEFDGKAGLTTIKIEEVNSDRMPPAKFVGTETSVSQPTPHQFFGPGRLATQCSCTFGRGHGDSMGRFRSV